MDANSKKRLLKIAGLHLGLTVLTGVLLSLTPLGPFGGLGPTVQPWLRDFLTIVKITLFYILQPQCALLGKNASEALGFVLVVSVPIWSLCFAWLYVKFVNWLNHFPVLGRKVF